MIGIVDKAGTITIVQDNAPCTIDGTQYPANFFVGMPLTDQYALGRYPVVEAPKPSIHQNGGTPSYKLNKTKKRIIETVVLTDLPLDKMKSDLKAEVNQLKVSKSNSPIVVNLSGMDYVFDMTPKSQTDLAGASLWALNGNLPTAFAWTLDDKLKMDSNALLADQSLAVSTSVDVSLDATGVAAFANLVSSHVMACHVASLSHKAAIATLTSTTVKTYDVTTWWPAVYVAPVV